jgi:hypothetical protein
MNVHFLQLKWQCSSIFSHKLAVMVSSALTYYFPGSAKRYTCHSTLKIWQKCIFWGKLPIWILPIKVKTISRIWFLFPEESTHYFALNENGIIPKWMDILFLILKFFELFKSFPLLISFVLHVKGQICFPESTDLVLNYTKYSIEIVLSPCYQLNYYFPFH